jgi:hypothetical protein
VESWTLNRNQKPQPVENVSESAGGVVLAAPGDFFSRGRWKRSATGSRLLGGSRLGRNCHWFSLRVSRFLNSRLRSGWFGSS